jgi:hypothetical protein
LKNPFHKQLSSILSLLQKLYDPLRVPKNSIWTTLLGVFSACKLVVGDKNNIGVYGLLQHTSSKPQTAILSILNFFPRVLLISAEHFRIGFLEELFSSPVLSYPSRIIVGSHKSKKN